MSVNDLDDDALRVRWRRHFASRHPTWPASLVDAITDLDITEFNGLLREYRFVPADWTSPRRYHRVLVIEALEYPVVVNEMRAKLRGCTQPVTWGPEPLAGEPYVARIDYHIDERPILVCIGGIR